MSLFRKSLASLGIGSARVDTVIKHDVLIPGDVLSVDLQVYGGKTSQQVDEIHLTLCCSYYEQVAGTDESSKEWVPRICELANWALPYSFMIDPHDIRHFEVELPLPANTPITIGEAKVWLDTHLETPAVMDPNDRDSLTVRPEPLMDGVFTALELAGLRIRKVICEALPDYPLPFVQTFEFVPVSGPYHGRWRKLDVVAYRGDGELKLEFGVDCRLLDMAGMMGSVPQRWELVLADQLHPQQAGEQVLAFLDSHR